MRLRISSCSLILIYLPRKDERLSRPGWLTYSGRFTHISGHPSAAGRAQDREISPIKDQRSTTVPRSQPVTTTSLLHYVCLVSAIRLFLPFVTLMSVTSQTLQWCTLLTGFNLSSISLPRVAMHSADYVVARRLSVRLSVCVRPSHAVILSKWLNISSNLFHRQVYIHTILVFPHQTVSRIWDFGWPAH